MPLRAAAADDLAKNIVVLVDQSLSVEAANRDSALKLVAGLVTGKVDDASRQAWQFKAPDSGADPAVLNLQRMVAAAPGACHPLAQASASFVINGLGNYERVTELIAKLNSPATGSPAEIAGKLLEAGAFKSSDNSTHISLAEAKVARTFLSKPSKTPYYLLVISDFYEDCLNWPVEDYAKKGNGLEAKNSKVLSGDEPFNDGAQAKNHKYSPADIADIRFLNDKIDGLLLGEFIYRGQAKTPVNVKVYSPVVKRSLVFVKMPEPWILPDAPPTIPVSLEGLDEGASLEVKIGHRESGKERVVKESCGLLTAKNQLDLALLLEKPAMKDFIAEGHFELTLSVPQEIGPSQEAKTTLEVRKSQILIDDKGLKEATEGKPCEIAANTEIKTKKFALKLDPPPHQDHDVEIRSGERTDKVRVSKGSGEFTLGPFLDGAESNKPIHLAASLKLVPTSESTTAGFWIIIPEVSVWAVYDGKDYRPVKDVIRLDKTHSLTLKASHAGMAGFEWRGTIVTRDGETVPTDSDDNHLDFSGVEPGTYLVTAKFGVSKAPKDNLFTVVVPKQTPWMLLALLAMVVISIGLFAWHFMRGRLTRR
ncbi:MAG: hypothetical protein NTW21_12160 [Verrucomicrobia bacterium]|nr:hypothetical protein [Verrucomicrobiota bacterium]